MKKQTKYLIFFIIALISIIIFCLFMHYITNKSLKYTKSTQFTNQKEIERKSDNDFIKQIIEYNKKIVQWQNQCYIKPYTDYGAWEIKDKFGKESRTIYNQYGKACNYTFIKRFFVDNYYIEGKEICVGSNKFDDYYDTTQPPLQPTPPQYHEFRLDYPSTRISSCDVYNEANQKN
ncbi:hypothetical protein PA0162 [Candidatus Phytoplasma australiense]|uniref:Uncharacterized protein n=1 Tax=Phytoplasma australiense TaxID=59748 RepID=B1V965_PHYAS|nr:hypothetical protein PA0162 [Candidatus Phytoplasma australiense]